MVHQIQHRQLRVADHRLAGALEQPWKRDVQMLKKLHEFFGPVKRSARVAGEARGIA
jgi:hypothetical protein